MTAADHLVPEPTHPCVRCGRPVALSIGMCDRCNPLGLADPAATQVHGSVFLAVAGAVVVLAVLARLALSGIGPFQAAVSGEAPTATGLSVTLTVTNQGSRAGSTTCRVHNGEALMNDAVAFFQSPRIEPGATVTFTRETAAFGAGSVANLTVECSTP
jgi:hypothetical protein